MTAARYLAKIGSYIFETALCSWSAASSLLSPRWSGQGLTTHLRRLLAVYSPADRQDLPQITSVQALDDDGVEFLALRLAEYRFRLSAAP